MIRKLLPFILGIAIFLPSYLLSQSSPLNNTLQLSLMGGTTFNKSDYKGLHADFAGKISLEYFFELESRNSLGIRLFGLYGYTSGADNKWPVPNFKTKLQNYGGGLVYGYQVSDNWIPYIFVGASILEFDPTLWNQFPLPNNQLGLYEKRVLNYNLELGLRAALNDDVSFNFAFGANYNQHDWLDDIEHNGDYDHFGTAMLGISVRLFGDSDSDGDGVSDGDDRCPDTPKGVEVDEFGCPRDSDNDGVPDYLDQCLNTPPGTVVDEYGCPVDSDGDGVSDSEDECPNTPAGVRVDARGCPRDLDNDGVADYLDRCPNTPPNTTVDDFGCPIVIKEKEPIPVPVEVEPEPIRSYDNTNEHIAQGNIWTDGNSYVVQSSAWRTEKKANAQAAKLSRKGFESFVVKKRFSNGRTWYRVRVGYYRTLEEAKEVERKLR